MKISLFDQWGSRNSTPVWQALGQGLEKQGVRYSRHDSQADVAVIWSMLWTGRMKPNSEVWHQFRRTGRPVVVAEVGMLRRGHTWKLGINGIGRDSYAAHDLDHDRVKKLGIKLEPWRNTGQDIVIAMQRQDSYQWHQQPVTWLDHTVNQIKQHTKRNIIVRPHPRQRIAVPAGCQLQKPLKISSSYDNFDFETALTTAWAVVNWNSSPGCHAVIQGVPAFVGPDSLAADVGNLDLACIENPQRPPRQEWLTKISHSEWTLEELSTGMPLMRLLESI
jgi:hypothetical protein